MKVTFYEYDTAKHELFSLATGEDGHVALTVIDPAARSFGESVLQSPVFDGSKWIKAGDAPASWLSALPVSYSGSRVQAQITER